MFYSFHMADARKLHYKREKRPLFDDIRLFRDRSASE